MKRILKLFKTDKVLRSLFIIGLTTVILGIIFYIIYKVYCEGKLSSSEITFFIGSVKDIFQTIFFILIGVLTILSYLQARKTLFTPIKTETFKMQIKAFEDILAFFQTKTETDFTTQFDFDFIVSSNTRLMFADFITHFHKDQIKIDEEKLKDLHKEFCGAIMTHTWAERNLVSPDYFEKKEIKKPEEVTNPALILEKWKNYEYGPIQYSNKFNEAIDKLNQLIASPIIPTELKDKLEAFDKIVRENLYTVGKVLNTIAQELPQKFPTANSIKNFDQSGVWNVYNREMKKYEPIAKEILSYIRQYLKIDKLID
jgi:hypothetical protein